MLVQHNLATKSTRQLFFVRSRRIMLWTAKLCITPPCTQQRQHPQTVKFHRERAFINTSHSSSGLPTEDYAELAGMPSPRPRPERGASPVAKHGEQKDQWRLDTCIPNTRGWCPIREQTRPDSLVREQRKTRQPADGLLGPARNSQICGQQGSPLLGFSALHCLLSTGKPISETNIDSTWQPR